MKKLLLIISFLLITIAFCEPTYFVRYKHDNNIGFGKLIENKIQPLKEDIFNKIESIGDEILLRDVELLIPTQPQKVFAVGMNFSSHLSSDSNLPPPMFFKSPSSLIGHKKNIVLPKDATNVHFEGELVLIIGKKAKNISIKEAKDYIFAVSVGNDLTERNWQGMDLQWLRAKASDGFGPIGSIMAKGLDYNNLVLTTKLNGKIVQRENTKNMIHKPSKVVSFLSKYFTLMPGDLIYMGTPGRTQALKHNDIISVSIDKIGIVENTIITK
jgi:2-keto-4-pentenoate hydratase/2-oxohepta-3-ene-1,7-dioic acid hydratase in catechol pathway